VKDFLKDDLSWKIGKPKILNSCVSIETSPTNYGESLLVTQSCDSKMPFICEVSELKIIEIEYL